ncbi:chemotaxis protein [Paenibacillus sp. PK3_47]|uniref:methyl-accepting chemotaxis protein n=1 Tax=Paenibacillus sp. PK3_47 TaxID=2072642 RepID=UPI00201E5B78|nr:methyl-accepting chemotaxis protein [Paenibacillus sp. PK3_47]UQZ36781.1 chemotaxis protein [Paenibacillus sp. PK3_47]
MIYEETINNSRTQVLDPQAVMAAIEQSLAMIQFDTEGRVLWANDNFAKAMGYTAAEMPGLMHRQFCTTQFVVSAEYKALWRNLRSGLSFQDKILRVAKDGRLLWFEATYTPIFDQKGLVKGILKVATDITARENTTTSFTNTMKIMAEDLRKRTDDGIASTHEIAAAINRGVQKVDDTMEMVKSLQQEANSVRGIINTISDVASQTQLLSLNAAIEAAHAGEHGRGFSVVADEVRKLSKQAEEATRQVNISLSGISAQVNHITSGMKQSQTIIIDSQALVKNAVHEFSVIGEAARELDQQAQTLADL